MPTGEDALEYPQGLFQRLRRWAFGDRYGKGVLNQTAPASCAGDSPGLTTHGAGPSHAHDPLDDVPPDEA